MPDLNIDPLRLAQFCRRVLATAKALTYSGDVPAAEVAAWASRKTSELILALPGFDAGRRLTDYHMRKLYLAVCDAATELLVDRCYPGRAQA